MGTKLLNVDGQWLVWLIKHSG